jgi:DNA-binding beta-propeller fold protein YncE
MNNGRLFVLDAKNSCILSLNTSGNDLRVIADQCGVPGGIAVDKRNNHIYWTNMGEHRKGEKFFDNDGSIERIDFNGSNRRTIIPKGNSFTPEQMQLDMVNGFIYWSDREGMRVMRAKLDGSDITTLIQTGVGEEDRKDETRYCAGIAIDVANGHLYWTQKGPPNRGRGRIFRAGLDLLPGMDPANRNDIEVLWRNLPEPIDLEIDHLNGNLYWTDRGDLPYGNTLNRSSILKEGMGFREILCSGLKECIGLALDLKNDTVYFSDLGGNLYSCQLDGFNRRVLYSGDRMLTGIAYVTNRFGR